MPKAKDQLAETTKLPETRPSSSSSVTAGPKGNSDHLEDGDSEVSQSPQKNPNLSIPAGKKGDHEVCKDSTEELYTPAPARKRQHNSRLKTKPQETTKVAKPKPSQKSIPRKPEHQSQSNDEEILVELKAMEAKILQLEADKQTSEAETKASKAETRRLIKEKNQLKQKELKLENYIEAIADLVLPDGHSDKVQEVVRDIRTAFTSLKENKNSGKPDALLFGLFNVGTSRDGKVLPIQPEETDRFLINMKDTLYMIVKDFDPVVNTLNDDNFRPCEELQKGLAAVTCSSTYDLKKAKRVSSYYLETHNAEFQNDLLVAVSAYFVIHWIMHKPFPPTDLFSAFSALKKLMHEQNLDDNTSLHFDKLRQRVGCAILDEKNFYKNVISEYAEELTEKLREVLAPFLRRNSTELQERYLTAMTKIFQKGLNIHVRTRILECDYVWSWPEDTDTRQNGKPDEEGKIIIFARSPACEISRNNKPVKRFNSYVEVDTVDAASGKAAREEIARKNAADEKSARENAAREDEDDDASEEGEEESAESRAGSSTRGQVSQEGRTKSAALQTAPPKNAKLAPGDKAGNLQSGKRGKAEAKTIQNSKVCSICKIPVTANKRLILDRCSACYGYYNTHDHQDRPKSLLDRAKAKATKAQARSKPAAKQPSPLLNAQQVDELENEHEEMNGSGDEESQDSPPPNPRKRGAAADGSKPAAKRQKKKTDDDDAYEP